LIIFLLHFRPSFRSIIIRKYQKFTRTFPVFYILADIQTDPRDSQRSFPARTRSLGSSAPTCPSSQRQVRHRASTIKASDFAHSSLPLRNRSGTVTQREFSFEGVALPEPSSDLDLDAATQPEDDEDDKGPMRRTRSGTITQRKLSLSKSDIRLPAEEYNDIVETESDDELLLTGPWPDEDWVFCPRPGEKLQVIADPDESDDELNLFNAGDPW
jgi:hypothetical protein